MRKKTKITIDPKYILILIVVISVLLIVVSFRFKEKMAPVQSAVGNIITPMQKGINTIGRKLSDQMKYVNTVKKLVKENEELQKKLDELSTENKLLQQDKYELDDFRKLYDLDEQYAGYPKVAARVISSDPDNWYNTFIIDKGSDDGLAVNMNVMAGDGLVGIITDVKKSYSTVRSIIDDDSNVYGTFLKTSDSCIVSGNLQLMNDGVIEVSSISGNAKVKDGYEVVTSQISDKYLPGILIGYVNNLQMDASNLTQTAYLTPAADFRKLDMVLVITQVKNSQELKEMLE
ncbi:MAG: rod shape-determining protein MreC [Lachnospiraceae bacterium]|nr:rod shape-determining protein MreC [Lachnospiraceae bacterium]